MRVIKLCDSHIEDMVFFTFKFIIFATDTGVRICEVESEKSLALTKEHYLPNKKIICVAKISEESFICLIHHEEEVIKVINRGMKFMLTWPNPSKSFKIHSVAELPPNHLLYKNAEGIFLISRVSI